MTRALQICCLLGSLLAVCGCESTVDAAKKLAAQGQAAFQQKGISVTAANRAVQILHSTVLQDQNGAAVVIDVRNVAKTPVASAPIAINVRDARGRSVFRNNDPGLETALAHLPLLQPGEQFAWVNDQIQPNGTPKDVQARIGFGTRPPVTGPPLRISAIHLTNDPVNGIELRGKVGNPTQVTQVHVVLFAVARKAGRVVAAGRAILQKLRPGKPQTFNVFFIGNPSGAQVTVSAPPSVIR